MTTKTAVIYARVSTARQAEEGLPVEGQVQRCKNKAERLGARVLRVFVDAGLSSRTDKRPEFQAAIDYCDTTSVDYFITWSTSRIARNKVDAGLYKLGVARAGTAIVYVSMAIDRSSDGGWMTESVMEIFDEWFSRQVAKDTIRSMVKNAEAGYWNGGRPPYGFRAVPTADNEKRKRLDPVPGEVLMVQKIFDLRLQGYGAKTIAFLLNEAGYTNRGKRWNRASIGSPARARTISPSVPGIRWLP